MPTYRYEGNRRAGDSTRALSIGGKTVELGGTIELTEEEHANASAFILTPAGFATGGTVKPVAAPPEPSKASADESAVETVDETPEIDESKSGSRSTLNVKPSPDDESLGRGL